MPQPRGIYDCTIPTSRACSLNPGHIFDTLNAYQRTTALKAAIDLDIFTAIGEGAHFCSRRSRRQAPMSDDEQPRDQCILCDYLVIIGFLTKQGDTYALTPESATFLDHRSPAYLGSIARFLTLPEIFATHRNLTEIVRKGHPTQHGGDVLETENPIWVEFARSMAAIQRPYADAIAGILDAKGRSERLEGTFDIAALVMECSASRSRRKIQTRKFSRWIGRPFWQSPKKMHARPACHRASIRSPAARSRRSLRQRL